MKTIYQNTTEAISDIPSGAIVAIGGFFSAGVPRTLMRALKGLDIKDLTIACGTGAVRLLQIQREGKAAMDAGAFLRGTGSLKGAAAR